jgi:hypothetical protein
MADPHTSLVRPHLRKGSLALRDLDDSREHRYDLLLDVSLRLLAVFGGAEQPQHALDDNI